MKIKPIPLILISAFSVSNQSFADGGLNGAYGGNDLSLQLIGKIDQANAGVVENGSIGSNGKDISQENLFFNNISVRGMPGGHGGDGVVVGGSAGGGGRGGDGGGSVIGGVSNGGNGGSGESSNLEIQIISADGGGGGNIGNSKITINQSDFYGGIGGDAGEVGANGGEGGGSVFGGQSNGGNAGLNADSANGGKAGNVFGSVISVSESKLFGADGGVGSAGGQGGGGGGSVLGGLSVGGNANISSSYKATGGMGGDVFSNFIEITDSEFFGGDGGEGGWGTGLGAGDGGNGGGSIIGGFSSGGEGGVSSSGVVNAINSNSDGGAGGAVYKNQVSINKVHITGGVGGVGGDDVGGGASDGGIGGGSIFGGLSIGGNGGTSISSARGGDGGAVFDNTVYLGNSKITGGVGGDSFDNGDGGYGGGSIYGGLSIGGNAGNGQMANGGDGGDGGIVKGNTVYIINSEVNGADGGEGGDVSGYGGHGGGSVFGGFSSGGTVGMYVDATGGRGGDVYDNFVYISDSLIKGANGGAAGTDLLRAGMPGGSIYGGYSVGGSGNGFHQSGGGRGGDVYNNKITISGDVEINGSIYGGYSQGGALGDNGEYGLGGAVYDNIVTLIGDQKNINGFLYGGLSVNGDGKENLDPEFESYYKGNTLQIQNGRIEIQGVYNFQNYNWLIPKNEFDGDVIVSIQNSAQGTVNLNNTIHRVDVDAEGNTLNAGDQVVLIDKVSGTPRGLSRGVIEQGFFIVYDAEMVVEPSPAEPGENRLVLNVLGVKDGIPDGKTHPESEEFLKGRIAQMAVVDQSADMISDGISYARASLRKENANIFTIVDGGSNKYKNGSVSTLKLNDFKFALGAAKAWELESRSVGMVAAFAEHGNANYSSYNNFDYFGEIRGSGKLRYSGLGLMFHMDVADTDKSTVKNKPNIFDEKYGLYLDAALRVGHVKVDFHSADMVNGEGVEASYNTKSRYASAMAGVGYVWTLDEKRALDFYGRFTFSRLNGKDIQVVDEQMNAATAHSKRLRLGARYGYAYSATTTPYAGVAFERNFTGDVTGSAYGFTIKETSLKGNTGLVEAGVMIKPQGADDPFSLHLGVQGYFGQRKGATADIRARYVF